VGAGQLGSRHLQGLSKASIPLDIWVSDIAEDSLARANVRWQEVEGFNTPHRVNYVIGLTGLPTEIDLAIVATSADVRAAVVTQLAEQIAVHYWVLEKVLAQSDAELLKIQTAIEQHYHAWINTPWRTFDWYKKIKAVLAGSGPLSMVMEGGGWGLACNAVHYLDLVAWLGDCELLDVNTNGLSPTWKEAKRKGFWEVFGTLNTFFSKGADAKLVCCEEFAPTIIKLRTGDMVWMIDEDAGMAKRADGLEITGKIPYQSENTGQLAESILLNGHCYLPNLRDSVRLHQPFLHALTAHWNQHMPNLVTRVPIT